MSMQASISPAMTGEAAQKMIEKIIRESSKTFFFATQLLPLHARYAIHALYGFCRASDDLVDRHGATQADLEAWRAEVALPLERQANPILFAWTLAKQKFPIQREYEQELLDGVLMDINFRPYQTWTELECYCYQVASTVGLLSIPVIGLAAGTRFEEAAPYAIKLGIALQLTNILRDVAEDGRNGRVYIPEEDLRRFGLTRQDILAERFDERFEALMRFEIERADRLYDEAIPGIALLHRAARPAVGAAALLYRAILREIEKLEYNVFRARAYTSGWKKIWLLPGIMARVWSIKPPQTSV